MRPIIALTAGDPAGIGLEVILKAIPQCLPLARWILFTDREIFERNAARFGAGIPCRWIDVPSATTDESCLFLHDAAGDSRSIEFGHLSPEAGKRALAYLKSASDAALAQAVDAVVTAPVSKEAIGPGFHGQTDFLAEEAKCERYAMAFFAPALKVVLATIHVSLRDALNRISTAHYVWLIRFVHAELTRLQFPQPRIAVAAINPHAGEGGMFGNEDQNILAPAVNACAADGIDVSGPYSADSLYFRAHSGEFDVVIAPYHDQGLIPVKLIAHGASTNVTLGLPYVRTSPDHGTAFAIAGKGEADSTGMLSAMRCALDLVQRRIAP